MAIQKPDALEGNEEPLTANSNFKPGPIASNIERFPEWEWAYKLAIDVFGIGNVAIDEIDFGNIVGMGFQVIRDGKRGRWAIKLRWEAPDPKDPDGWVIYDWNHPNAPADKVDQIRAALKVAHGKCLENLREE